MMLSISLGRGKERPSATERAIQSAASVLAKAIEAHQGEEAWWSPSVWNHRWRRTENWLGASAVAVDVDFSDQDGKHAPIPADVRDAALDALAAIPVSLHHPTPRGLRAVFLLDAPISDPAKFEAAAAAANLAVSAALAAWAPRLGVDEPVTGDRARLLFTPRATVGGNTRSADVKVIVEEPMALEALLELGRAARARLPAPPPPPAAPPPPAQAVEASDPAIGALLAGERASSQATAVEARRDSPQAATAVATRRPLPSLPEAVEAWNRDHAQAYPKGGTGDCPMCGHRGCFGTSGDDPNRWSCFSTDHGRATGGKGGRQGNGRWFGDQLDIEVHRTGRSRRDLLVEAGYLDVGPKAQRRRQALVLLKSLPRDQAFEDFRTYCRTEPARLTGEQIREEFADAETWAQIAEALGAAPEAVGQPRASETPAAAPPVGAGPARAEVAPSGTGAEERARSAPTAAAARYEPLRFYSEDEILSQPPVRWLIDRFIPTPGVTLIHGPSNCGKSFVAIDIAKRVVRGMPWCGMDVEPGAVVMFVGEGQGGMGQRAQAWKVGNPDAPSAIAPLWMCLEMPHLLGEQDRYLAELHRCHQQHPISLIIIDTLSRAISGENENAAEVMTTVTRFCENEVANRFNCAVVLVHHERKKSSSETSKPSDLDSVRGSGSLGCSAGSSIGVSMDGLGLITLENSKQKDGAKMPPTQLVLEVVGVNPDWKGRPCTAPYVRHVPPKQMAVERAARKEDDLLRKLSVLRGKCEWPMTKSSFEDLLLATNQASRSKARATIAEAIKAGLLDVKSGARRAILLNPAGHFAHELFGAREGGDSAPQA